jgi:hypothetical protein
MVVTYLLWAGKFSLLLIEEKNALFRHATSAENLCLSPSRSVQFSFLFLRGVRACQVCFPHSGLGLHLVRRQRFSGFWSRAFGRRDANQVSRVMVRGPGSAAGTAPALGSWLGSFVQQRHVLRTAHTTGVFSSGATQLSIRRMLLVIRTTSLAWQLSSVHIHMGCLLAARAGTFAHARVFAFMNLVPDSELKPKPAPPLTSECQSGASASLFVVDGTGMHASDCGGERATGLARNVLFSCRGDVTPPSVCPLRKQSRCRSTRAPASSTGPSLGAIATRRAGSDAAQLLLWSPTGSRVARTGHPSRCAVARGLRALLSAPAHVSVFFFAVDGLFVY